MCRKRARIDALFLINEIILYPIYNRDDKMKKILIILGIIIVILASRNTVDDLIIPAESIRIRVVANSNNSKDQIIKQLVKNKIEEDVTVLLQDVNNIEEARTILKSNVHLVNQNVLEILEKNDYNTKFKVEFGYNLFPEKRYKGVVYEEGYYESLVITLGSGDGDNWWCVLFPPLCLMETDEDNLDKIEYKSFIKEIIEKYF